MNARSIHPLGDHVVVAFSTQRDTSAAGILIPDIALEAPQEATVLAAGPGSRDKSGVRVPLETKPGDHVLVARHAGARVILDDETYTIVRSADILAIHTS